MYIKVKEREGKISPFIVQERNMSAIVTQEMEGRKKEREKDRKKMRKDEA
jgi:hypothetical protein